MGVLDFADARLRHLGTRAVTAGHACQQYRVLRGEVDNLLNQLALSRDRGNATAMKPALANLIELVNGACVGRCDRRALSPARFEFSVSFFGEIEQETLLCLKNSEMPMTCELRSKKRS